MYNFVQYLKVNCCFYKSPNPTVWPSHVYFSTNHTTKVLNLPSLYHSLWYELPWGTDYEMDYEYVRNSHHQRLLRPLRREKSRRKDPAE